jgi:hypothetical protein
LFKNSSSGAHPPSLPKAGGGGVGGTVFRSMQMASQHRDALNLANAQGSHMCVWGGGDTSTFQRRIKQDNFVFYPFLKGIFIFQLKKIKQRYIYIIGGEREGHKEK